MPPWSWGGGYGGTGEEALGWVVLGMVLGRWSPKASSLACCSGGLRTFLHVSYFSRALVHTHAPNQEAVTEIVTGTFPVVLKKIQGK